MFSFFKRKKAPAPQEAAPGRDEALGAAASPDAPEVAPVAPTELPDTWPADAGGLPETGADAPAHEAPAAAAEPVSEFVSGAGPAPAAAPVQPPDAWSDRPDETADPLVRLDRAASAEAAVPASSGSWLGRLRRGLSRTGQSLGGLFTGVKVDEALFEELETALIMADAGVEATEKLLEQLRARVRRQRIERPEAVRAALRDILAEHLKVLEKPFVVGEAAPMVVMIAGVNGAGKTTSIGKLAHALRERQASVLLAAGDTFRAAAREQLQTWGERNNVTVIAQDSGDSAAVIFDAVNAAKARGIDIVLADTAGRLPTQLHLMEEIAKVRRVIAKAQAGAPHEVLLVLDANIGQNALAQVKAFDAAIGVTGLVLTKLDGTAKGGVVAAIARQSPKPLRFIGVGEGIDDLRPFCAREFVDALFARTPGAEPGRADATA